MLLTFSLLSAAAAPPSELLPLGVGNTWTYSVHRTTRAARVMLIFGGQKRSERAGEWTLRIQEKKGDRYAAQLVKRATDGAVTTTDLELWEQEGVVWMRNGRDKRPAIEATLPPRPVAAERVRCVAHVLGSVVGTCAPLVVGPLVTPPGLVGGVLPSEPRRLSLDDFLTGAATLGMVIPAGKGRYNLRQTDFTAGPTDAERLAPTTSALVKAASNDSSPGQLAAIVETTGATVDEVAAALHHVADVDATLAAVLPSLVGGDRYPALRTAMQHTGRPLRTLARARPLLDASVPSPEAKALLALFEADTEAAQHILDGTLPFFTAVVADQLSASGSQDDQRIGAVFRQAGARPIGIEEGGWVLSLFDFDTGRNTAATLMMLRVEERKRLEAALEWVGRMTFDDGRATMLENHEALFRQASDAQKEVVVSTMSDPDRARALLGLPLSPEGQKRAEELARFPALAKLTGAQSLPRWEHLPVLKAAVAQHGMSVEEGTLILKRLAFDSDREEAIAFMLPAVNEAEHGAAVLAWLPTMAFDSGRLKLIEEHQVVFRGLSLAERQEVARTMRRKQPELAELLGL